MKLGEVFSGIGSLALLGSALGLTLYFIGLGLKDFAHSYRTYIEKIVHRESCIISDKEYFPSHSRTETRTTYFALQGNLPFPTKAGEEIDTYSVPEHYFISFKCGEIGLAISKDKKSEEGFYERLNEGQVVKVFYQDTFENSYVASKLYRSDLVKRVVLRVEKNAKS